MDHGSLDPRSGVVSEPLAGLVELAVEPSVEVALRAAREMLGMEVAYVSEIVGADSVLRVLEGDGESFGIARELSMPSEHTYCQRMLDGELPNLIPDVRSDERVASLPITQLGQVGAFATVPLTFGDGRLYGTLCAASHDAQPLDDRELQFLKVFARLIADQLEREDSEREVFQLAALVRAADDAIIGMTMAAVVTSWNPACERLFGYPANEAIGQSVVALIALPGDEDGMRRALAAAAAGEIVHRDARRRQADGGGVDTSATLAPIRDEHGDVTFLSAVIRDNTGPVREARHRAIERAVIDGLESAGDASDAAVGTLRGVGQGLDCQLGALWELDADTDSLRVTAQWTSESITDTISIQAMRAPSFGRGDGLPGGIWASGEAAWIERVDQHVTTTTRARAAAAAGLRSAVAIPLRSAGEVVGVAEFFTRSELPMDVELLALSEALIARLADALQRHRAQQELREAKQALEVRVAERTSELRRAVAELEAAQIETVHRLSRAVEFRDEDTGAHTARISAYAARIASRAGIDHERCRLIERASPLHDVGKVAIPDSVLLKPGPLTPAERAIIETHAEIGHRLLDGSDSAVLQMAASIALTHHEHYNGAGYPRGLAGESIPIEGRIVAIADVFDALTSDRVYRPAMTVDQAAAILRDGRGTHFDPVLLDHFLADPSVGATDPQPRPARTTPARNDHLKARPAARRVPASAAEDR